MATLENRQLDTVITAARGVSPVIWISGFSAAGKTTVGRKVERMLRAQGIATVLLDGDDLRSIFAGRWGYSREERVELARIYFRLCSHLAAQGIVVVICAIAMYDDVREWLKEHVSGAVEVFLDVPEKERRARDRATKDIYEQIGAQAALYDEPRRPDLIIRNYGDVTPETASREIVDHVIGKRPSHAADHGRADHWRNFYTHAEAPNTPSSFAREIAKTLDSPAELLEVGCGNGRDASFFASQGLRILALDKSDTAIETARAQHNAEGLTFIAGGIADLPVDSGPFDAIYSRFCLHAMTPAEEDEFLAHSALGLRPGASLFIECRSINDPLARQGEIVSKTERIFGHYRRFVIPDELRAKLSNLKFQIDSFVESAGLAKLGEDDPVVIRVCASTTA
jgi:adenylylsulfate kinase-like enzyme/ubiquinone/menaquinone biosynthesis C-methylase UbiE